MSTRYPGGVITKTPVVPAGPYETGAAPGVWTLDQQLQAQKAGIWPIAGNAVPYIEDVFSTYLYTGNGSTQTITTGVDTGTKGGLIWVKKRSATDDHALFDSVRASGSILSSNLTDAATAGGTRLALTSTGFDLQAGGATYNQNGSTYASWTFREQPKFFDVVTYTGNGVARTIAHNLGSVPGCIIVKSTSATSDWPVYHRGFGNTGGAFLNETYGFGVNAAYWNNTDPTSSVFTVGTGGTGTNINGETYVAYLFAHDAGGFGPTGTDNVISCGSYSGTGVTGNSVTLGYEPQWVLIKKTTSGASWALFDTMRGMPVATNSALLSANTSAAEDTSSQFINPTATGFTLTGTGNPVNGSGTYIYIAIRRGPMKVPTSGTSVFNPAFRNATLPGYTSNFPVDWATRMYRPGGANQKVGTRLLGGTSLQPNTTSAAASDSEMTWDYMSGWGNDAGATSDLVSHMFRRAPGFFDVVCYTGTGVTRTVTHNLTVAPELMIVKSRSGTGDWKVWNKSSLFTNLILNSDVATQSDSINSPTTTTFSAFADSNTSSVTYVAYLFATVAGVSKVGSYTGTGTTQVINCGFTAGSRFVMIKRTDSTGDWYVWDSARGIVAGNDPFLWLNSTAAENTSTDYVDTAASGFEISSTAPAAINANGGSFIFLSIA